VRLIEQIGSYAGLAAIPGLGVLSALYFSQARDVKRLREWAGRAPERAAEQEAGGRAAVVQAQPQAARPAAGGAAAAAKPAAAGAVAATAGVAATGDAAASDGAATPDGDAAATTPEEKPAAAGAKPATPAGAAASAKPAAGAAGAASAKPAVAASTAGAGAASAAGRTGPPPIAGVRPAGSAAGAAASGTRRTIPRIPSGSQTSILGPSAASRDNGDRWYHRLPAARYIVLIVAGVLVLGGGAAFGISRLAAGDAGGGGSGKSAGRRPAKSKPPAKERPAASISPSTVTVTVVNGTSVAGLARDTAAELSRLGFQIGNKVTGTGSLAAAESVVQYKPGAGAEARLVAEKLHINQREPADADAIAQAGPASVIVVLGADKAPGG
jgi:hypothetical protein